MAVERSENHTCETLANLHGLPKSLASMFASLRLPNHSSDNVLHIPGVRRAVLRIMDEVSFPSRLASGQLTVALQHPVRWHSPLLVVAMSLRPSLVTTRTLRTAPTLAETHEDD